MAYLAAITAGAGVPLFVRTKGNLPALSFPVVGSLNGVHMYASSMKASLISCTNGGAKVTWECFHDSVTLILVSPDDSPTSLHSLHLLQLVFGAMVLLVGLRDIEAVGNMERLNLKSCYPLIDSLLDPPTLLLSPITQCADVVALELDDSSLLQSCLDSFTESVQSNYGCLFLRGKILVATESWWELSSLEVSLLSLFVSSLPPASCRDIPVYLPHASRYTAHRMLVFTLLEGLSLAILCDQDPPLLAVQGVVASHWTPKLETLQICVHNLPRCIPLGLTFDPAVMALCLVSLESRRCVTSLQLTPPTKVQRTTLSAGYQGEVDPSKKLAYLCRFYCTTVDNLLPARLEGKREEGGAPGLGSSSTLREALPHRVIETYVCTKRYKAYALNKDGHNLFILFANTTPTFALRKLSLSCFESLTRDRSVQHCLRRVEAR